MQNILAVGLSKETLFWLRSYLPVDAGYTFHVAATPGVEYAAAIVDTQDAIMLDATRFCKPFDIAYLVEAIKKEFAS